MLYSPCIHGSCCWESSYNLINTGQSRNRRTQHDHSRHPKPKPERKTSTGAPLPFGRIFTDHMLLMDYSQGQGWHDMRIVPYANFSLPPSAMVFHYAQEVFEGMKAYPAPGGAVTLFRPMENLEKAEQILPPPLHSELPLDSVYEEPAATAEAGAGLGAPGSRAPHCTSAPPSSPRSRRWG